jgi:hypothetical protein
MVTDRHLGHRSKFDIAKECGNEAGVATDIDRCSSDETMCRLKTQWAQFGGVDKRECVGESSMAASRAFASLSAIPDIITWVWSACRVPVPKLQTTGAAVAASAFCPRSALRHELHQRSTRTQHINCAKSARNLLASCLSWFLSDGGFGEG